MTRDEIVAALDEEIARLEKVRALLNGTGQKFALSGNSSGITRKRNLSADARKRIADAQRRRWAKQKKLKTVVAAPAK
jgi:hypothetical protein